MGARWVLRPPICRLGSYLFLPPPSLPRSHAGMDLAESIGLQAFTERDAAGNPLLEEDEQLLSKFERMQLVLGTDADQGEGTLFATPRWASGG